MRKVQILGIVLLAGAFLAGVLLQAFGLLSTEVGRSSASWGSMDVEEVVIQMNWLLAAPLAAIAVVGLACLVIPARWRR